MLIANIQHDGVKWAKLLGLHFCHRLPWFSVFGALRTVRGSSSIMSQKKDDHAVASSPLFLVCRRVSQLEQHRAFFSTSEAICSTLYLMTLFHDWRSTYLLKVKPNFSQVDLVAYFGARTMIIWRPSNLGSSSILANSSVSALTRLRTSQPRCW